jgi:hypothetical protein
MAPVKVPPAVGSAPNALRAAEAVVAPVPPLVMGTVPRVVVIDAPDDRLDETEPVTSPVSANARTEESAVAVEAFPLMLLSV